MLMSSSRLLAGLVATLALALSACSGGGGGGSNPPTGDHLPPSIPTGVAVTPQSPTEIQVSWSNSVDSGGSGLGGYRIYRNGGATPIATVTTNTYTDSNLTPETNYSYTLRSFDMAVPPNESGLSASVGATTPAMPVMDVTPPTVPTNLVANALSPTQVQLTWTASTDAGAGVAGYRIYRNGGGTPIATVNAGTTFTNSGLTANTAYTYAVSAFDAATPANESALTGTVNITTPVVADTTPPTTPTGLTATVLSTTQIRLSWTASTDAGSGVQGYRIFTNTTGTGAAIATPASSPYVVNGLTPSTTYNFTIRAIDNAAPPNESAVSGVATATTQATPDTTAPTVPGNVVATALSSTQISITWSPSTDTGGTGVAGYRIYRDGSATLLAEVTGTSYTDSGLTGSTTYSYRVRAFDNATPTANVSALSTAANATTQATPDTTAPTVPGSVAATVLSTSQIQITWTASTDTGGSGVGGYHIFRNGSATALATVTGTSFTDSGLTANTTYTYRVSAFDLATPTANESALSSQASATTPAIVDTTPPTVPANVLATALSSSQIQITWTASTDTGGSGVGGYRLFRDGSSTILATVTGTSYTDSGLTASTAYSYRVRAFDLATPTANVSALSTASSATTQASGTATSGLDTRPSNTSCVAGVPPSQSAAYTYQQVFSGNSLGLDTPVAMVQAPGDNSRWYVVQQAGVVKKFNNVASPGAATNFVNLSSKVSYTGESGLLGMAFHPNYPTDPRVYFYYRNNSADRLSEFRTIDGGTTLDATTENVLFSVTDPQDNHNGGNIAFGPDGSLYIGIGDGGGGDDQHSEPTGNGQRLTILLGKMLRINVGNAFGDPYTIPAGNPFSGNARCNTNGTGTSNCPEIFAYGFRNPWRWSFDRGTGDLWVGDVGESEWEEIDKVTLGGNYGWRCREGAHNHLSCGTSGPYIDPVVEIGHGSAGAITGGYVYRGSAIPGLNGRYLFGDFSTGWLWDISRTTTPTTVLTSATGVGTPAQMPAFAEDLAGELYFFDYGGANIYKIVPNGGGGGTVASLLSQTGCANASNPKLPSSGMIPYAPNAPFWSDGAIKTRWLALPNGGNIDIDGTTNDFDLPIGSVLRKDFALGSTMVETRLFMRHTGGTWAGYTYQWNAQGTEATRVISGLTTTVNGTTWEFPSESACLTCHTSAAGRTLGLEVGQLNGNFLYPSTGRTANQIYTLNFIDTLRPVITLPTDQLPVIPNPFGTSGTETDRARAWLHSNCSNCHRPSGGTPVNLDFRYTTTLMGTNTCDVPPTLTDLGISNARLIAPGDAARSVVLARVNRTGTAAMPPLARHYIDTQGVALLRSWINSLSSCN